MPRPEFCYDAIVWLSETIPHGESPLGQRFHVGITGGAAKGPDFAARIVPGGYDWQLLRRDGYWELEADYFMETDDGTYLRVENHGLWYSASGDWPADYAVTTPRFEAPSGPYEWMNQHVFTGTVAEGGVEGREAVRIAVYKMV
ncbi:DUF3237 domain-containing protein [Erythrobacter westpacificensis]|uniref:DUF3237 domain-containing protein n=1 Tax=Erythrobacter westpacificensis TaxID=1055231 RepID=UPI0031F74C0C